MQTHLTPGPVRRFERGATLQTESSFLDGRGIKASFRGSGTVYLQQANGTYRTMNQMQFAAFVDAERIKAGLPPIRLASLSAPKKRGPKRRVNP